jgi:hypothetical protein
MQPEAVATRARVPGPEAVDRGPFGMTEIFSFYLSPGVADGAVDSGDLLYLAVQGHKLRAE